MSVKKMTRKEAIAHGVILPFPKNLLWALKTGCTRLVCKIVGHNVTGFDGGDYLGDYFDVYCARCGKDLS